MTNAVHIDKYQHSCQQTLQIADTDNETYLIHQYGISIDMTLKILADKTSEKGYQVEEHGYFEQEDDISCNEDRNINPFVDFSVHKKIQREEQKR